MSSVYVQALGNVKANERIVLARPAFTITGTYIVDSLEPVGEDRVRLRARRVDAGDPQAVDAIFAGDLGVGVVPPEKHAMG
jgi:hypothetical protein